MIVSPKPTRLVLADAVENERSSRPSRARAAPTAARFCSSTARTALVGSVISVTRDSLAEHLRDRADEALVGDDDVLDRDPLVPAGRDRDALVERATGS